MQRDFFESCTGQTMPIVMLGGWHTLHFHIRKGHNIQVNTIFDNVDQFKIVLNFENNCESFKISPFDVHSDKIKHFLLFKLLCEFFNECSG